MGYKLELLLGQNEQQEILWNVRTKCDCYRMSKKTVRFYCKTKYFLQES